MKGKWKRGADDLDFDDFDEGSGEWSGMGAGLDKTSALCTVANEEEAGRGNFDDKYHSSWPEPLPWMDDAAVTFIPDLCRSSLDEKQDGFKKYVQVILTLICIHNGMLLADHIFCRTSSQLLTTEARLSLICQITSLPCLLVQ